jgi:hypothetical protein
MKNDYKELSQMLAIVCLALIALLITLIYLQW